LSNVEETQLEKPRKTQLCNLLYQTGAVRWPCPRNKPAHNQQ